MIVQQVEKHVINKNHPYYAMFCEFTHQSKNLYNHANYLVRKEFVESGKWLRYHALCKLLRHDIDYPDYADMPAAQSAQQTLRLLDANWVTKVQTKRRANGCICHQSTSETKR